jgi:hypothetical protein
VIPAMDHIDEYLTTAVRNMKISKAIRAALALGKQTLNRYYNKTDQSEVYRIAMSSFFLFFFLFISFKSLVQFYTLVINSNTLRKLDGKIAGLKHLVRSSVVNLIKLMPLWMSKNTLTLLPLLRYFFFTSLYFMLTLIYPSAVIFD